MIRQLFLHVLHIYLHNIHDKSKHTVQNCQLKITWKKHLEGFYVIFIFLHECLQSEFCLHHHVPIQISRSYLYCLSLPVCLRSTQLTYIFNEP